MTDLNITHPAGPRCIALVGPQGGGKTSLLESILHITGATSRKGSIKDGTTLGDSSEESKAKLMSTELAVAQTEFLGEPWIFLDCPGSLVQLVSRLLEIILDHSARSGIAHVNQYNRSLELSVQNGARDWCVIGDSPVMTGSAEEDTGASRPGRVQLFIIKPRNQIVGSLLEFEPANSRWLIRRGYEDTIQSCVAV